tara:strand:+ start:1086 stop:1277 length:192 start_codon:yes stop_codon:yes gene_type:complete
MYGLVGETIQWDTPTGVLSGEIMFVHTPEDIDYYSIATGPNLMDRHFLDSDAMSTMNVENLSV